MIIDRTRSCHRPDFRDPRGVWSPVHEPAVSLAASTAASGAEVLRRDWDVYRDRRLAHPGGYRTPTRAADARVSRRRQAFSGLAKEAEAAEANALARAGADLPGAYAEVWHDIARLERRVANAARAALHQLETGAHA